MSNQDNRARSKRASRNSEGQRHSETDGCQGFKIFRPLDKEQARDIRRRVYDIDVDISIIQNRGFMGTDSIGMTVMSWAESKRFNFLKIFSKEFVLERIEETIPTLHDSASATVLNIGSFGGNGGVGITSVGAALDTTDDLINIERGGVQQVLCEMNGWFPVDMRDKFFPHVSVAKLPSSESSSKILEYKRAVAEIVPAGTELHFGRAIVTAS